MAATKQDIRQWFLDGVELHATHMIVVCDTYDYEDYPVYVMPDDDVRKIEAKHQLSAGNMQRVMEVYNLSLDREEQLNHIGLVFNY